jgi:hypothetical protein
MKTKREIFNKLLIDTDANKIYWEISLEEMYVKATYIEQLTDNKQLLYKIVYYKEHPKSTKFFVIFKTKSHGSLASKDIFTFGGNKKIDEVRLIAHLLKKVLKKDEKYNDIEIEIDNVFKPGDKVIVIKGEDFGEDEVGEKGTIVREDSIRGEKYYLVEFNYRFRDVLIDRDYTYGCKRKAQLGNCWFIKPDNLRKVFKKKTPRPNLLMM